MRERGREERRCSFNTPAPYTPTPPSLATAIAHQAFSFWGGGQAECDKSPFPASVPTHRAPVKLELHNHAAER